MIEVFVVLLIVCYCEAKIVKGESRTKEKLCFFFSCRAASYLAQSESSERREQDKGKAMLFLSLPSRSCFAECLFASCLWAISTRLAEISTRLVEKSARLVEIAPTKGVKTGRIQKVVNLDKGLPLC